jgi:hypothetical protein
MKGRKLSQEIRSEGIGVHGHVSRPKKNADDVTPSCGLLLTCRGEKYTLYHTMIRRLYYCVESLKSKC